MNDAGALSADREQSANEIAASRGMPRACAQAVARVERGWYCAGTFNVLELLVAVRFYFLVNNGII